MIQQTTVTTPDTARVRANADSSIAAALGEFALLTLCTLPGMVFSYQTIQEPWTLFRIARASMSLNAQHILTYATSGASYRSEHIGGEMLQVLLLAATQLPLEAVSLLPVGSLLLAILFYAAARTISTSKWTAVAIAIFASWYYPGLYSQFGTETYAWTHSLFIVFLILHILWMRKRNAVLSTLIMIIFTSTFLHYHTSIVDAQAECRAFHLDHDHLYVDIPPLPHHSTLDRCCYFNNNISTSIFSVETNK